MFTLKAIIENARTQINDNGHWYNVEMMSDVKILIQLSQKV